MIDWQRSYCGPAPDAATWLGRWNGDPWLIAGLVSLAAVMVIRPTGPCRNAGLAACAILAFAFLSPLCALTTALFSARSVHHLLLVGIVAPLFAVAFPARRDIGTVGALAVSTAMLWAWHLPTLYDAALGNVALYWAMQIGLVAAAWWFWSAVRAAAPASATAAIVGGAVQMGFLGAVLTFAPRPLYAVHAATTVPFGIGPLADQQIAGLLMWVPGMAVYAIPVAWIGLRSWRTMTHARLAT